MISSANLIYNFAQWKILGNASPGGVPVEAEAPAGTHPTRRTTHTTPCVIDNPSTPRASPRDTQFDERGSKRTEAVANRVAAD